MYRSCRLLSVLLLLQGCDNSTDDVYSFVTSIKSKQGKAIKPLPEQQPYSHYEYDAAGIRSPFDMPLTAITSNSFINQKDCLQPNIKRDKSLLEAYALDSLVMKGTLAIHQKLWALVQTKDGVIYKVRKGDYIGFFHGKIIEINEQKIILTEMITDGSGCWLEQESSLLLEIDI